VAPESGSRAHLRAVELAGEHRPEAADGPDSAQQPESDRPRPGDLAAALSRVRDELAAAHYPLAVPTADTARDAAAALINQLDGYILPRLLSSDAPLLAVVGGSTGAGKSTLVNSLVQAPVSRAGVIRPTTRSPLLVSNPADTTWFARAEVLPDLARSSQAGERTLQLVNAPALRRGVALLDAPDIDSVVAANRELARELLAAGDLWLFVTTAARYADAVPWRLLREARDRGTAVAVILDRVPPEARDEVSVHFGQMLAAQDLGDAPLFVILESTLDGHGLLPEPQTRPVKQWLDEVASSTGRRRAVTSQTLLGAVNTIPVRVEDLAVAADQQVAAQTRLAAGCRQAYAAAMSDVEARVRSGVALRGDVYAQWLQLLASGDLTQALRSAAERHRSEALPVRANQALPGLAFLDAVATALAGLIAEADMTAAARCREAWRARGPGRDLLAADPSLGRARPGFAEAAQDLVQGWQQWLRAVARADAPPVRTPSRSYATAATVLFATIAALAPQRWRVTGPSPAAGVLRTVLDDDGLRQLGERARAELLVRVGELLQSEVDRHLAPLADVEVDAGLAQRLREAGRRVWLATTTARAGAAA
jgi:hypothetical protein